MTEVPNQFREEMEQIVGKIIMEWTILETMLMLILTALLGSDQFRVRVVYASMPNLRARATLINRLAETFLYESELPAFRGLMKRVTKLGKKRNKFAHRVLSISDEGECAFLADTFPSERRGGFEFSQEPITRKHARDLHIAITELWTDLGSFLPTVEQRCHTSPQIHRERQGDPIR